MGLSKTSRKHCTVLWSEFILMKCMPSTATAQDLDVVSLCRVWNRVSSRHEVVLGHAALVPAEHGIS